MCQQRRLRRAGCACMQARAHLLSVGIMRPAADVTAIDVNAYLSSPHGAPVASGKVAEVDKSDVPRFLNRQVPPLPVSNPCWAYQALERMGIPTLALEPAVPLLHLWHKSTGCGPRLPQDMGCLFV